MSEDANPESFKSKDPAAERPGLEEQEQPTKMDQGEQQPFEQQVDHFQSNLETLGESPSQDCNEARPIRSEMVAPSLTNGNPTSHRPTDKVTAVDPAAREGYNTLKRKFSKITTDIYKYLEEKKISIDPFLIYLTDYNLELGEGQKATPSWKDVLLALKEKNAIDFLNYHLLVELIDLCFEVKNEDYHAFDKRLNDHGTEVEKYKSKTLILDFLDIYIEYRPEDLKAAQGCELFKLKLSDDSDKMTLADFSNIRGYAVNEFRLHHYMLHLVTVNSGCVIIYWQVPEAICLHIKEICEKFRPDFGQAGIIELSLGDHVLYQAKNICDIEKNEKLAPVSDVMANYDKRYEESIKNPKKFWFEMAIKTLIWNEPCTAEKVMEGCDMQNGKIHFFDGKLNASVNCLDRHAKATPNKTAIIWEKNDGTSEKISYYKLLKMTCQIAHVLTNKGVVKGDVVIIYMSSSPIAVAAMLACTRIGAIHSVVFAVLKVGELKDRIRDADAKCIITSSMVEIGKKKFPLKSNLDSALHMIESERMKALNGRGSAKSLNGLSEERSYAHTSPEIRRSLSEGAVLNMPDEDDSEAFVDNDKKPEPQFTVLVTNRYPAEKVPWDESCNFNLEKEMEKCPATFDPVPVEAEDTMFIMYTSGTTSNSTPTCIKHSTAGYLLYTALTHKYVFDYKPGDVFGCMSVLGWITGQSYVVYGPLCNGATTLLFDGTATHPDNDRYWKAIEDHKINQFYVTPHVISSLMKKLDDKDASNIKTRFDLSSLKTIATVGEPLNSKVRDWFRVNIGSDYCKFVDTWWQTETGGIAIIIDHGLTDLPAGNFPAKPFFGVDPVINDIHHKGTIHISGAAMNEPGYLCLKQPLPGMARFHDNDSKESFKDTYYNNEKYGPGFFTSDLALTLENGGYKITGRQNGAMRIQGVWLNVADIEDQLMKIDVQILRISLVGLCSKYCNQICDYFLVSV